MIYINSVISIQDVQKKFNNNLILNNISFNIPKGSVFAFLGLNGAGKSTLLNIILDILLPTKGIVLMNNKKIDKNKIGVVFQENTFDDEFTIYENLFIRGKMYNIKKDILKKRIITFSEELSINSILNKKYKLCSGGEKRIAMIIRALITNPDIIIMDEPTTALDIDIRKKLWNFLLKLNKEKGLTIFFSSHYIEESSLATNLCILHKGKIVFNGSYNNLIKNYSKKILEVNFKENSIKKEIKDINKALLYLRCLDLNKIDTFSLSNSNLEDIFLYLVHNENTYI